jgi:hypothetical protein
MDEEEFDIVPSGHVVDRSVRSLRAEAISHRGVADRNWRLEIEKVFESRISIASDTMSHKHRMKDSYEVSAYLREFDFSLCNEIPSDIKSSLPDAQHINRKARMFRTVCARLLMIVKFVCVSKNIIHRR